MSDDFLDARFDPNYKNIFESKLEAFDAETGESTSSLSFHFFGDFESKTKLAIKNIIQSIFKVANNFGLDLKHSSPEVDIYTLPTWSKSQNRDSAAKISIPAAKINWKDNTPHIEVIIPVQITKSETVIKTIRLLCSKLFGTLFFKEHISKKKNFKQLFEVLGNDSFGIKEKLHFCHFLDEYPKSTVEEFKNIGLKLGVPSNQAIEIGKKEFFKKAFTGDQPPINKISGILEEHFNSIIGKIDSSSSESLNKIVDKIFKTLPQVSLILPHEQSNYSFLKQQENWTLFHALEERFRFVVNIYSELDECLDFIKSVSTDQPLDYSMADLWKNSLQKRLIQLKKTGLVKIFLIENVKMTSKMDDERARFPLWLWRHGLFDQGDRKNPPDRVIKINTEKYKNSSYQKLFELCQRLTNLLQEMQDDYQVTYDNSKETTRVKTLFAWFEIRKQTFNDLLNTCLITTQLSSRSTNNQAEQNIKDFESGWSYFISFALIHLYYKNIEKKKKDSTNERASKFFQLISNYITARIETSPSFRIAGLFLSLYQEKSFNLNEIVDLIQGESEILDFFILNQSRLLKAHQQDPIETINHYSETIRQWRESRQENQILREELKEFKVAIP